MRKELGMGYCGLVCAFCSENAQCVGCKEGGCPDKENCKNYQCCTTKGYISCADCSQFPCEDSILFKLRVRTFCKIAKESGDENLIQCIEKNLEKGIIYHYPNQIVGDYDACENESEIRSLLEKGK
ncbi:MAG: DUF3795 domain-containing protein [Longicatena sp.]